MKIMNRASSFILCLLVLMCLASCEKVSMIDDGNDGKHFAVSVKTRSATDDGLVYPITIRVSQNGSRVTERVINNEGEGIDLSLPNGSYNITAFSGTTDFPNGYSNQPLLFGSSDITVASQNTKLTIVMGYAVAAVDVSMADVPSDVTAMTVSLSPMSMSIGDDGGYDGNGRVEIACRKEGNAWKTGRVYVFPSAADRTVMTIGMTSPSGTTNYSVSYQSPIKAAMKYVFNGSYSSGAADAFSVTGSLSYAGWTGAVSDSFSFGPGGSNSFDSSVHPSDGDIYDVASMPTIGSVWDGHVIGYIEDGMALLLSTKEWTNLTSALYESDPEVASALAAVYAESGMEGWHIPTADEARLLKSVWNSTTYEELNATMTSLGGDPVTLYEGSGNARYLCDNALRTFSFVTGGSVLAAGKTVKTYRLRVVKMVSFRKK